MQSNQTPKIMTIKNNKYPDNALSPLNIISQKRQKLSKSVFTKTIQHYQNFIEQVLQG